ncbi:MAG: sodium:solute symporter family protein [Phycisphaeraceae bacterium]|nr:sodium:solute symporter family protein [Phycisphaeraceae bacterium]
MGGWTIKTPELTVTTLYFAACIGIAFYFRRRAGGGGAAYWAADGAIGYLVNGVAQFSALLSAASFLGFLGLAYRSGWSMTTIAFGFGSTMGFALSLLLVGGPLRRYSAMRGRFTLSAFFEDRFGPATGLATTGLVLLLFPAYIIPQLMGGGLAASNLLGIRFEYAVILSSVVFVAYVAIGGMLSVTWTDFVQGLLMFGCMIGLSIVAMVHFGGPAELTRRAQQVNPHFLDLPTMPASSLFGLTLGVILLVVCSPHIIMRIFTARSVREGRAALALTAGISLVFHLLGYLGVAAAALVLFPELEQIDNTYIVVMNELFSPMVRGLATAGILAAIMSTTDAMLLAAGAEFSSNVYRRYINPKADDHAQIRAARNVMILVGVLATILAILAKGHQIGVIVGVVLGGTASAFAAPLVLGIWWRGAGPLGGFLGVTVGFTLYVALLLLSDMPPFSHVLVAFPASVASVIVGSLLRKPSAAQVALTRGLHGESDSDGERAPSDQTTDAVTVS